MSAALVGDLTAIFNAAQHIRYGRLDYRILDEYMREHMESKDWDFTMWFTLFDPANENQDRFINFLRQSVGWNISTHPVMDLLGSENAHRYKFDANMAFTIGRISHKVDEIFVVSGSYPLAEPLLELSERGKKITVVFFNDLMDPRWFRRLFYDERVGFLDIHEMKGENYELERTELRKVP